MSVQRICADREIWNNGFSYNKQVGLRSLRHLHMGYYCLRPPGPPPARPRAPTAPTAARAWTPALGLSGQTITHQKSQEWNSLGKGHWKSTMILRCWFLGCNLLPLGSDVSLRAAPRARRPAPAAEGKKRRARQHRSRRPSSRWRLRKFQSRVWTHLWISWSSLELLNTMFSIFPEIGTLES